MVAPRLPIQPAMHSVTASDQPSTAQDSDASKQILNLRLAVEASGEVIFMTDTAGTITYVNPAFVRVYGYRFPPRSCVYHEARF